MRPGRDERSGWRYSAGERVGREFRDLSSGLGLAPPQRICCRGARVPNLDGPVDAPRGDAPAVGTERHLEHAVRMPTEGEDFLSGRRVPQLDGPVQARRGQAPAVRTVSEIHNDIRVPAQVEDAPRGKVPD